MPRGITPIRVRRRQSDAKWRASVAMCYNIMKNVIPNQKMLGRRKVSKALTLKETERHIVNMERKLRELMEEKAPCCGKSVMISDEEGNVRCATFEDVKRDFAIKQVSFFSSNTGSGKKRYNIPADIEASLVNLSKQTCQLFVVNKADAKVGTPLGEHQRRPLADKGQVKRDIFQCLDEGNHSTPLKLTPQYMLKKCSFGSNSGPQFRQRDTAMTPLKSMSNFGYITSNGATTSGRPCNRLAAALTSPLITPQEQISSPGFTPVKLPVDFDRGDPLLSLQETPAKSFDSPFSFFSPVTDDENPNLLCTETIDALDTEVEPLGLTPTLALVKEELESFVMKSDEGSVQRPKCRRRLDIGYSHKNPDQLVPEYEQEPTLDSFLLYYNHHTNSIEETNSSDSNNSVSMPTMFDDFEAEKPSRFTSLTSYEDSMGLSSDLVHIDLEPLTKPLFKDGQIKAIVDKQNEVVENSQEVPDMNLYFTSQLCPNSNELSLVPDYEDLGIIYNKDCKEELFSFKLNAMDDAEDFDESSQVVPSF